MVHLGGLWSLLGVGVIRVNGVNGVIKVIRVLGVILVIRCCLEILGGLY
jgi:hypothetical protein